MLDLLFQGGPLIMGILSILLLWALVLSIKEGRAIFRNLSEGKMASINQIKTIGVIALVVGVFGQMLGLYNAFGIIEASENGISQQMLMGGLRVSLITPMYGLIIFLITRTIALVFNFRLLT
ncbi:MAG: MotA/TolQ/ExbB proton channel family protein [Bacteroidota bacterium]